MPPKINLAGAGLPVASEVNQLEPAPVAGSSRTAADPLRQRPATGKRQVSRETRKFKGILPPTDHASGQQPAITKALPGFIRTRSMASTEDIGFEAEWSSASMRGPHRFGDAEIDRNLLTKARLKSGEAEGGAALTTYLERGMKCYRSSDDRIVQDGVLDELRAAAADESLSHEHRSRAAVMADGLPYSAVLSHFETYSKAKDPVERRGALRRLRTLMDSESDQLNAGFRKDLRTSLEFVNARRLLDAMNGPDNNNLPDYFQKPNTLFQSTLRVVAEPMLRYLPMDAAKYLQQLGFAGIAGSLVLPYMFRNTVVPQSFPITTTDFFIKSSMLLLCWIGGFHASDLAVVSVVLSTELAKKAALVDSIHRPRLDSQGIDRTAEVAELSRGLLGGLTDPALRERLAFTLAVVSTFRNRTTRYFQGDHSLVPDTTVATALADFAGSKDERQATLALNRVLENPIWREMVSSLGDAMDAFDTRRMATLAAVDRRAEQTDAAMDELKFESSDLVEPAKLQQVRNALGGHEPLHGDGLKLNLYNAVVDPSKFRQATHEEMIRGRLTELRHEIVAPPGSEPPKIEGLDEKFDQLIAEARDAESSRKQLASQA